MRAVCVALIFALPMLAQQEPRQKLAREIFKELIEINTTDSVGDNTKAAEAVAARFRAAGVPEADIKVLAPQARKGNVVVRFHGTGSARPILFIGHLDVVEAQRADWTMDPFAFIERDGFFYGRGTSDMKGGDAVLIANFLRLKQEGFKPSRDLILALTADEEIGPANGMEWLLKNHRELVDAEFCVNSDGGGGQLKNGKPTFMGVQAAEKVFLSFRLEVTNAGGHSSQPRKDNAIYHLSDGLSRLAKFDFPVKLFDVTRSQFERAAGLYPGQLGADLKAIGQNPGDAAVLERLSASPLYNALIRTTCVPTMMTAGHAENALPQTASATVNCRLLPVDNAQDVQKTLRQVLADPAIAITEMAPAKLGNYKPLNTQLMAVVTAATNKFWPGLPVIPLMTTGASDGVYTNVAGIPTYGVDGLFGDEDDVRAHGRDERVLVKSFYDALDFYYEVITGLGR